MEMWLSPAPWLHACIVSWSSSGILAWKGSPASVSHHRQPVCRPRVGQCNVPYFSCLRSPALRKQCLLQVPFPRSHQRARTLPVAELRGPTEAPNGVGNLLQARRSSQARRRRGGRGGRIGYAPSSPAGALAPSTAVLATSACAVSTTTASGSITVWAKGTTGESGPRAQGGLGMRGSECESRDLETALRAGWGRECLEKLGAGVHSPCAALRLMLLMAASWDS